MLRRLHPDQPESFAFTEANQTWAEAQIRKYPEGRQASAIIPLLWRAQEQEGWLTRPAIEGVAEMLQMPYIRALEVATFYFMFQLQPVGSVAHVQICGTLSCMICGAEDLMAVCKEKIAAAPHQLSDDGKFSWEEVECLGACANAPMAQIGKDYYEDLTTESLSRLLDEMAEGNVPAPGPQNGRYASEPGSGLTSLTAHGEDRVPANASVTLATDIGDTLKRIDGTEVPFRAPWDRRADEPAGPETPGDAVEEQAPGAQPERDDDSPGQPVDVVNQPIAERVPASAEAEEATGGDEGTVGPTPEVEPERMDAPRDDQADDLTQIRGVGPGIAGQLNELGIYHFSQIGAWGAEEIAWIDARLSFRGRVERDQWVEQAQMLMKGESPE
ncbi:NADH-quinone oxidoreductase subunit E [Pseudoroseicyclus tamaricis]|uniref:NADH-quinone oxidoreductase subunit E n=1 Tax=Pseudoroseicyclus tamaricis TaxID=2705421 RepID=A0A6B2JU64_9RHOB|nr:NADH-quinone oxidoreductase subunit E [Pseudoroseicyclus tamaricis]NDV01475.1 NADH-quinone oxidoreductase subunit E [Pseudoroseicyclus tamaricis]